MARRTEQPDRFRRAVAVFRKCSALLVLIAVTASSAADTNEPERANNQTPAARRRNLGRTEKFRIMVDKVMTYPDPGEPTWKEMSDEIIRQIAGAGFNVVVPRGGGENLDSVRAVAQRAGKQGVYSIAWLRGTLHLYEKGERWDKQRMTWPSGFKQDVYSPNMDRLRDRGQSSDSWICIRSVGRGLWRVRDRGQSSDSWICIRSVGRGLWRVP